MCGFGDSWTGDYANEQADAIGFGEDLELIEQPPAIIVMVKNPKLGTVKTRLAATIGDEAALKWYLYLLNHTRETTLQLDAIRYLYYSVFVDGGDEWSAQAYEKRVQSGVDLGDKMYNAFAEVFSQGHQRVIIIGSDCLDLRVCHLKDALEALREHDFVIGPAEDGGYYLLGMRSMQKRIFENKTWSTKDVLPATLADFENLGKTYFLLPTLADVDQEVDLLLSLNRLEGEG